MCAKNTYTTAWEAKEALHRARARSGDLLAVYSCASCDGWHLGHPPLSARLSEDRKKTRRR